MMNVIARRRRRAAIAATTVIMSACGGEKKAPEAAPPDNSLPSAVAASSALVAPDRSGELPPAARVALDSGNALYRAKRFPQALAQYRLVVKRAPDDVTGYFGIYMVADAMQSKPLADSALVVLRARGMVAPTSPHVPPNDAAKRR